MKWLCCLTLYRKMGGFALCLLLISQGAFAAGGSVAQMRTAWKEVVANTPEYPEGEFSGRGIVIPAGGRYYLINAWVNLCMLRASGCTLPVEIWYIGEKEEIPSIMGAMAELGAECKDITEYYSQPIKGFQVKAHAIMASQFEEILLLDADNIVLENPEYLFEEEAYLKTGTLFWLCVEMLQKNNVVWKVLDLVPEHTRGQESGQLLVNKRVSWKPLHLTLHMNQRSDFYYTHLFGDKDTFMLSWKALGLPYHMILHLPALVGDYTLQGRMIQPIAFLQKDCEGTPLFCHSALKDWAQRTETKLLWSYYQDSYDKNTKQHLFYARGQRFDFSAAFPGVEEQCISFMQEVKKM